MRFPAYLIVACLGVDISAGPLHAQNGTVAGPFNLDDSLAKFHDVQKAYESKLKSYQVALANDAAIKPGDKEVLQEALKMEVAGFRSGSHTIMGSMAARSIPLPPLNKPEIVTPSKEQAKYVGTRTRFIAFLESQAAAASKTDAALGNRLRAAIDELRPKAASAKAVPVFAKQVSKQGKFEIANHSYIVAEVDGEFDFNKAGPKLAKELGAVLAPIPNTVSEVIALAQATQTAMASEGMGNMEVQTGATCKINDHMRIRNGNDLVDKSIFATLMELPFREAAYSPASENVGWWVTGPEKGREVRLRRTNPETSLKMRLVLFQLVSK